jgi:rSAM/selenodomain-associated transferase 1
LLLIFARAPRMGRAKTRLARDLGVAAAWRVNRLLHARTLRAVRDPRWRTLLCVAGRGDLRARFPGLWPDDLERTAQGPGDLGARLMRAFRSAPAQRIAVIGADAPDLRRADIAAAFRALNKGDAVFGPAADGGFWLLALKRRVARRLDLSGVRWSSEHALADVRDRLPRGSKAGALRQMIDVDDAASWRLAKEKARPLSRPGF